MHTYSASLLRRGGGVVAKGKWLASRLQILQSTVSDTGGATCSTRVITLSQFPRVTQAY